MFGVIPKLQSCQPSFNKFIHRLPPRTTHVERKEERKEKAARARSGRYLRQPWSLLGSCHNSEWLTTSLFQAGEVTLTLCRNCKCHVKMTAAMMQYDGVVLELASEEATVTWCKTWPSERMLQVSAAAECHMRGHSW
jgi:hypothetical protein